MKNTPIFSIRKITLIALLSTLAYIGRLLFAWIPNVQPVTVILLIITLEMGLVEGILTASLSMILSNIFLGMGPWTLYQIASIFLFETFLETNLETTLIEISLFYNHGWFNGIFIRSCHFDFFCIFLSYS